MGGIVWTGELEQEKKWAGIKRGRETVGGKNTWARRKRRQSIKSYRNGKHGQAIINVSLHIEVKK